MSSTFGQDLPGLVSFVAASSGLTVADLRSRCTATAHVKVRRRVARIARGQGFTLQEIGGEIGRHHSTVVSLLNGRRP